jgi:hypothetical protein
MRAGTTPTKNLNWVSRGSAIIAINLTSFLLLQKTYLTITNPSVPAPVRTPPEPTPYQASAIVAGNLTTLLWYCSLSRSESWYHALGCGTIHYPI